MEFKLLDLSQCKKLDFKPSKSWPVSLPPILWEDIVISGFNSQSPFGLMTDSPFEIVFHDCYPQMTLSEWSRMYTASLNLQIPVNWELLFSSYGLRWHQDLEDTLVALNLTSENFQNWVSEKELGVKDLAPLVWFSKNKDISLLQPLLNQLSQSNASKSNGTKILEWAIELWDRHSPNSILSFSNDGDLWYENLNKLRYPVTSQKDFGLENNIKFFPWPRQVQAQWKRWGDQSGIEIKFNIIDAHDYKKKITALNELQGKIEDLWNQI